MRAFVGLDKCDIGRVQPFVKRLHIGGQFHCNRLIPVVWNCAELLHGFGKFYLPAAGDSNVLFAVVAGCGSRGALIAASLRGD